MKNKLYGKKLIIYKFYTNQKLKKDEIFLQKTNFLIPFYSVKFLTSRVDSDYWYNIYNSEKKPENTWRDIKYSIIYEIRNSLFAYY